MAEVVTRDSGSEASMEAASDDEQVDRKDLIGGNEGWANVFAKVLTQNPKLKKSKKTVLLSKARKDDEIESRKEQLLVKSKSSKKRKSREPMKIVDGEGNVVDQEGISEQDEDDGDTTSDDESRMKDIALDKLRRKKERLNFGLVQAQPGDPYEKNLLRTATKGVVQLFNAVNRHQKEQKANRQNESSDEEDRRYKKGRFMDTLYKIQEKNKKGKDESKWEALKDDFMMNSKMRDWDKQAASDDDEG